MYPHKPLRLYRKRLIPDELILLDRDRIVSRTDDILVTQWQAIRPRQDFSSGCSAYYLKKGFKVSKFIKEDGEQLYYYCDIIEPELDMKENTITICDLLADVIVEPDGKVKVLDIAEIVEALDTGILDIELAKKALLRLDSLLNIIYNGHFPEYCKPLTNIGGRNDGSGL